MSDRNIREEGFTLPTGPALMVGRVWWPEGREEWNGDITTFNSMTPVTYFLQLGLIS
jgi:hypothetical protein